MSKESPIKPAGLSLPSVPAFWPMAMAMTMFEDGAELYAKNLKFVRRRDQDPRRVATHSGDAKPSAP